MPTYEYRCEKGHEFEAFQKMSDPALTECPECGAAAERRISAGTGLVFKGSGFYITDYKRADEKKAAARKKASESGSSEKSGASEKGKKKEASASGASGTGGSGSGGSSESSSSKTSSKPKSDGGGSGKSGD